MQEVGKFRKNSESDPPRRFYEFGPFRMDPLKRVLWRNAEPVPLIPKAFDILLALVENHTEVVTKQELMQRVWPDTVVEEGNLGRNISTLRRVLGESPGDHQYIVTLPGRGYRFVAEVRESWENEQHPAATESSERKVLAGRTDSLQPPSTDHSTLPTSARRASAGAEWPRSARFWLGVGTVLALIGVAMGLTLVSRDGPNRGQNPGPIWSVAVLPFENLSGDPAQEYLSDGLTEALETDLAEVRAHRVLSRTAILRYQGTRKPLEEVSRELGVDAFVVGSVARFGDQVRVTAQLIDGRTERHLWASTYERDMRDILGLEDQIAWDIAADIGGRIGPAPAQPPRPFDPAAYDLYLKGRFFWNKRDKEGLAKGAEYFQQAIQRNPHYAQAYAGLADCLVLQPFYDSALPDTLPRAKAAAERALALDADLAEAHTSVAAVKAVYEWDWAGSEKEFRRAIELNPNYALAHHWYAVLYLAPRGRSQDAMAQMQQALALDPVSPILITDLGWTYFTEGQSDRAIEQYKKALGLDPDFIEAHYRLSDAYRQKRLEADAVREFLVDSKLNGNSPADLRRLAKVYRRGGYPALLRAQLEGARRTRGNDSWDYWFASRYAELDEKDLAIGALEKSFEKHDTNLIYLRTDPHFASLRSDPRFQDLLQRIGLAP